MTTNVPDERIERVRRSILTVRKVDGDVEALASLERELTELREELEDWRESARTVIKDKGAHDEIHCTCVPALRRELTELRETLDSFAAPTEGEVPLGLVGRLRALRSHLIIEANRLRSRAEKAEAERDAVADAARKVALGPNNFLSDPKGDYNAKLSYLRTALSHHDEVTQP